MNRYFTGFHNNWLTDRTKPGFVSVWIIFPFTSAWIAGDHFWSPGTDQVEKVGKEWVSLSSMIPRKGASYPKCPPLGSTLWPAPWKPCAAVRSGGRCCRPRLATCRPGDPSQAGMSQTAQLSSTRRGRVRQRDSDTYRCSDGPGERGPSAGVGRERGPHHAALPCPT